jgi:hypothetical protein
MTDSILDALDPADAQRVLAAGNALTLPQGWSPIAAGTPAAAVGGHNNDRVASKPTTVGTGAQHGPRVCCTTS